jgi:alpha-D-xyloside xylohydrolase
MIAATEAVRPAFEELVMTTFEMDGDILEVRHQHEVIRIEPWGSDSVRVRAAQQQIPDSDVGALANRPPHRGAVQISTGTDSARLINGELTVQVTLPATNGYPSPLLSFLRTSTGAELLSEEREHFWWPGARAYFGNRAGSPQIHQQFRAYPGEKLFGMGQRTHGRLDHKGLSLDLLQRNAEVSIPFVLSDRGYGFLWNNPAVGSVQFAENHTRWSAGQAPGIDYWITTGGASSGPADIMSHYADATGHAPRLPQWASGFWQSKLRYRTQEELLEVAREHRRRGLPLSVIVADFFHWTAMGDFRFDPLEWPDPKAMIAELDEMGVQLMVSIWPTISPLSENFAHLRDNGLLIGVDQGVEFHQTIQDKGMSTPLPVAFYDPTNPRTREFIWSVVQRNYADLGIKVWWLDACEPELNPGHPGNLVLHAGPGAETASIYPRDNARMFSDGMASLGQADDTVLLCRSAWAGQQQYGAAVWSGDIPATWESLQQQIRAGLSIAVAGIPWWTTDIGGFHGGNAESAEFRELVVRWFQYGVFCPLFRLHGDREPRLPTGFEMTGGPNEVWAFGAEAYAIIAGVMALRERLRPYLHEQMDRAAANGLPPMRPLFVDFPNDPAAWQVDDQFMFGPDLLIAPVAEPGMSSRPVYLPVGTDWVDAWDDDVVHVGGSTLTVDTPLERIPVYRRAGATIRLN